MYSWIWRRLPGGLAGKVSGSVVLFLAAVALLFYVVFPYVEPRLPWNHVNVTAPASTTPATPPTSVPGGG